MNRALKAFLRAMSRICLWGAPVLALLAVAGSFASGFDPARTAVVSFAGVYVVVIAFLIGGALRLLLSIDDRLERLEGNH